MKETYIQKVDKSVIIVAREAIMKATEKYRMGFVKETPTSPIAGKILNRLTNDSLGKDHIIGLIEEFGRKRLKKSETVPPILSMFKKGQVICLCTSSCLTTKSVCFDLSDGSHHSGEFIDDLSPATNGDINHFLESTKISTDSFIKYFRRIK